MTAAQIAEIVGTERKAWWPGIELDRSDGQWHDIDPSYHPSLKPSLAELAFIGAAVRELVRRAKQFDSCVSLRCDSDGAFAARYGQWRTFGDNELAALVAAITESEETR